MKTIKKFTVYSFLLAVAIGLAGCLDLDIENTNNPDRFQVLAEPEDVAALPKAAYDNWWGTNFWGTSMTFGPVSDMFSCSWANWGMRDTSAEPRVPWNNSPSYSREEFAETPWYGNYESISTANDALAAIAIAEAEESPTDNAYTRAGLNTGQMKSMAKFVQGIAHAHIAMNFDKGFIVREDTDLTQTLEFSDYNAIMAAAQDMLAEARTIALASSFTLGDADMMSLLLDQNQFAGVISTFRAFTRSMVARTPAERAALDWATIKADAQAGMEFVPIGDDNGDVLEWHAQQWWLPEWSTWTRVDNYSIGPGDTSGNFANWIATPVAQRQPTVYTFDDLRLTDTPGAEARGVGSLYSFVDLDGDGAGDLGPWPPARGTYHYSFYGHTAHAAYEAANANGPMPVFPQKMVNLLVAEAELHLGNTSAALAIINATRTAEGGLPELTGADAVGSATDRWKPHSSTVWAAYKWEMNIYSLGTLPQFAFYTRRGWGDLTGNSFYHLPVPGKELETLQEDIYTFGGGGEASASGPSSFGTKMAYTKEGYWDGYYTLSTGRKIRSMSGRILDNLRAAEKGENPKWTKGYQDGKMMKLD